MAIYAQRWKLVANMSRIEIVQFSYLSDNYGILLNDSQTQQTVAIDAGDAKAYDEVLDKRGWSLSQIWVTHHHWDHTDGINELYERWNCEVIGPAKYSTSPIAHLSTGLLEGDSFQFADVSVEILHTPGHTLDMINFYLPSENILFVGDTLFSLGCGRVFEGDMEMMFKSINKISELPDETIIYCSHEYTEANGKFASSVDSDNLFLTYRLNEVETLLNEGNPTIPTNLRLEKQTNPFLRTSSASIKKGLGLTTASEVEVFAALRIAKDKFKQ